MKNNVVIRMWKGFWRPSARFGWGAILIAGAAAAVVFWSGFSTFVETTNSLGFCISCHEMEQNVYQEYKKTIHYNNRTGVRTTCPDCHVPREWFPKLVAKTIATKDLYHHLIGTIDTPEKFEAQRLEMAERVWASMAATDSRECRNCHSFEAMAFEKQHRRAREKMQVAMKQGETCIECHKGIAHSLPQDYDPDD